MEKKVNIAPFIVGDKVVYITGISMPKNSRHIVSEIRQDICGCWTIGINGIPIKLDYKFNTVFRCSCGAINDIDMIGWDAKSFRKIAEQKPPMLTFEKIKEDESVKEREEKEILILN